MAFEDTRGHALTAGSAAAVAHLDRAVESFLGLRADPGDHLKAALAADGGMLLGHVLRGYFMLLFANRRLVRRAEESLANAEKSAAAQGETARERLHMSALAAWCRGDVRGATDRWENILIEYPRDAVALRLAHYWHFYFGDSTEIRDSVARTLHGWGNETPGYGFVQGMYAFGLEESGDYKAAERLGRAAIDRNPEDIWAAHAVAHVMEMQGRAREGIDWISGLADQWDGAGNFAFHVWWHRALFWFELGDFDAVLDLYDREVRPDSTDDYLDISNAAALLWRLEQEGVSVGGRWTELAARSADRADDHMLVFADAHYMMAFAAAGDEVHATALAASTRDFAETSEDYEAGVARGVGVGLLDALIAYRTGDPGRAVDLLLDLRPGIVTIGGSHAQRDVFDRTLIDAAVASERLPLARALLSERLQRRPNSGLTWRQYAKVLKTLGDGGAANASSQADRHLSSPEP